MAAIHLFIDSSTFLTFYAYTSDDLDELKKVAGLIKAGKLKLYIPEQVADEFYRSLRGRRALSRSTQPRLAAARQGHAPVVIELTRKLCIEGGGSLRFDALASSSALRTTQAI